MQYFRIRLGFSFLDVTGDMPTFFLSRQKNFCFCTFYFFCLDNMHTVLLSEFCFGFLLSEFFFNNTEHIYSFIKYSVHFIFIICHYLVNLEDWNLRKIKWQKKLDWCSALVQKLPTIYDAMVHICQLPPTCESQKSLVSWIHRYCLGVLVCSPDFLAFTTGNGCCFYFFSF